MERDGIATTQISLIREHTEIIKPPRALWVSFPLGRPLGNPQDPKFQRDVLKHALSLLEYPTGPVLEDYPHDAMESKTEQYPMACPVNFTPPAGVLTDQDDFFLKFRHEYSLMQTWHSLACEKKNCSTTGVSGLTPNKIRDLFCNFISGKVKGTIINGKQLSEVLRLASEDLKACYFEGRTAQPGQSTDSTILTDWFWGETHAAQIINELRKVCSQYAEDDMVLAGKFLFVPRNQLYRFNE
ncbi:MAG: hypothetical protein ACI8ZB_005105 [Desulforhopalus sp.]|jgi:hypothetical protein